MEYNGAKENNDSLFGYFMAERNQFIIPLFGKWTEWNEL